jgi:ethylmalonyl-CoA/methylmalonyl-CoA decarboxylase
MMFQLLEKLKLIEESISKNQHILALVIRGEGDESFCAGADLSFARNYLNSPQNGFLMGSYMTEVLNRLRQLPVISICCVNGAALGGGAELATVGDFRIFGRKASIQFVHARIGASPGWGGALRLCSIAGRGHALRLLGTSEKLSSEAALAIGLADFIAEPNASWQDTIEKFLQPYVKQPYPLSVRAMKQIISNCDVMLNNPNHTEFELATFRTRWSSSDNVEAVANILASLETKKVN